MFRPPYPSDLTDDQWAILAPLIPLAPKNGRPRGADVREPGGGADPSPGRGRPRSSRAVETHSITTRERNPK